MFKLASGTTFNPYRQRSQGALNGEELAFCQQHNISVGYDPAQFGWVPLTAQDDFAALSNTDETLSRLKYAFIDDIARQLEAVASGSSSAEQGRQQLFQRAAALAEKGSYNAVNWGCADQLYSELHREVARFLPLPLRPVTDAGLFSYRRWTMSDVDRYIHLLGNSKVWKYLPDAPPLPLDSEVAEAMIIAANQGTAHKVFAVARDRETIGQVRLLYNQHYTGMRGAEIAYLLGEDYWGQGLMSEILIEFTNKAFSDYNFDFLCAWIHPDNIGSVKCAERAGYFRDRFASEALLAVAANRRGFQRYKCYAGDTTA